MKLEKLEHLLVTAETWAEQLHFGQTYAYGEPYFNAHIKEVAKAALDFTRSERFTRTDRYLVQIIAYLHDIVEDTPVTITEIEKTFGKMIAECVLNLTKVEGATWESQWARATRHPLSHLVKKADMIVNLRTSLSNNNKRLIDKYTTGLRYLELES